MTSKGVFRIRKFSMEAKKVVGDRFTGSGSFFMQKSFNEQQNEKDDFTGFRLSGDFLVVKFLTLDVGYDRRAFISGFTYAIEYSPQQFR